MLAAHLQPKPLPITKFHQSTPYGSGDFGYICKLGTYLA